jgi:hypothetical protein
MLQPTLSFTTILMMAASESWNAKPEVLISVFGTSIETQLPS